MELLETSGDQADFGKQIIPAAATTHNTQAFLFDGYWEDIGTIEAFYNANLALTQHPQPPFNFYDEKAPIYTRGRSLPPSKLQNCQVNDSMIGEGCLLKDCQIHHSVLGIRTRIEAGYTIQDTLIMGADYYQPFEERQNDLDLGKVPVGIGGNTTIRRAIVDKNARIGRNVQLINKEQIEEADREEQGFYIRSGIIVILKNAMISNGTLI